VPRFLGLVLFLPLPTVLVLFTRAPLGVGASIGLGALLMVTHRFYARPFALARAGRRCLWCGGPAQKGPELVVEEPQGPTFWRACRAEHARKLGRFLGFASSHSRLLRVGILGTLALFLPSALATGSGHLDPLTFEDTVAGFRLGCALTVLPLGLWGLRGEGVPRPRTPFPVHIQALLGTLWVCWLFRIVGFYWLVLSLRHLLSRTLQT
jgi:hypothetical protein